MNHLRFDFEKLTYQHIDDRYIKVIVFNITLFVLFLLLGVGVFQYVRPQRWMFFGIAVAGLVLFWLFLYFYFKKELKNRKYAIQDDYVVYCSGLFAFTTEIIPFSRIQHTTIEQGWLSKMLGLARVSFFTAGSHDESIAIKGVNYKTAQALNSFVLNHLETHQVEEETEIQSDIKLDED